MWPSWDFWWDLCISLIPNHWTSAPLGCFPPLPSSALSKLTKFSQGLPPNLGPEPTRVCIGLLPFSWEALQVYKLKTNMLMALKGYMTSGVYSLCMWRPYCSFTCTVVSWSVMCIQLRHPLTVMWIATRYLFLHANNHIGYNILHNACTCMLHANIQ